MPSLPLLKIQSVASRVVTVRLAFRNICSRADPNFHTGPSYNPKSNHLNGACRDIFS
jgi:hypothetical protein